MNDLSELNSVGSNVKSTDQLFQPSVLQIAHGKIIPYFSSAYSLRCHVLISKLNRTIISVAGAIFKDEKSEYAEQYRSLLLTGLAVIKGNRSLEILISRASYIRKKYINRLKALTKESNIIIFEGPWQYPLIRDQLNGKLVVYDAHNVEFLLRSGNIYRDECKKIEGELLARADMVLSVTRRDMKSFIEIYGVDEKKLFYVPLETDKSPIPWQGEDSKSIVFIGSVYASNNYALDRIQEIASKNPEFIFEIIGSARPTRGSKLKNMVFHGVVDDAKKSEIMSRCFLALNTVTEGSGRNLKMVDYLAHGLPIISTPIGTRGFEDYNISDAIVISEPNNFEENIKKLSEDREKVKIMSVSALKLYDQIMESEKSIDVDELILKAYLNRKSS